MFCAQAAPKVLGAKHVMNPIYILLKRGPRFVYDCLFRSVPDSILQQVISGDYGNGVFQAAYACDRFERVWRELQFQGPAVVKAEIEAQLSKISTVLPGLDKVNIEEIHLRNGFVHRWHVETHVSGKNKEDLSMQAIYPNPANLPRLHLVGEAFSSQQGWTEASQSHGTAPRGLGRVFQCGANNRDLRCVLHPAPRVPGAGCKTRP